MALQEQIRCLTRALSNKNHTYVTTIQTKKSIFCDLCLCNFTVNYAISHATYVY